MDELADRFPPPLAGALCLDFANTLEVDLRDHLGDYHQLVDWSGHIGTLDAATATRLHDLASGDPAAATAVHGEALRLRSAVTTVFNALADGKPAVEQALTIMRDAYAAATRARVLVPRQGGLGWAWPAGGAHLDRPLWPVAVSAVELATSAGVDRVRRCAGDGCCWLFLDATRNRSRRWCLMRYCGNVGKSRRQAARRRVARHGAT